MTPSCKPYESIDVVSYVFTSIEDKIVIVTWKIIQRNVYKGRHLVFSNEFLHINRGYQIIMLLFFLSYY